MSVAVAQTAVVDPKAQLGNGVRIGHFSVIGPNVKIEDGTQVDEHVVITGHCTIGENNHLFPGTVIGAQPQDTSYRDTPTKVVIGDNNIFREHCTVNRATEKKTASRKLDATTTLWREHTSHTTAKSVTES